MSRELFNTAGKRLYLTDSERNKFLAAADSEERQVRTFCYVLAHTGCRISEALQLVGERIDFDAGAIVFESLKKRRKGVYRTVPVPPAVLAINRAMSGRITHWSFTASLKSNIRATCVLRRIMRRGKRSTRCCSGI